MPDIRGTIVYVFEMRLVLRLQFQGIVKNMHARSLFMSVVKSFSVVRSVMM